MSRMPEEAILDARNQTNINARYKDAIRNRIVFGSKMFCGRYSVNLDKKKEEEG
jgi:hypothetical protein